MKISKKLYKNIFFIVLIFSAAFTSGCNFGKRYTKIESKEVNINSNNKSKLILENINGNIKIIKSSDSNKVNLKYTLETKVKKKDLDKPISDLKVSIETTTGEIKISGEHVKRKGIFFGGKAKRRIDFELYVPENLVLEIDNMNGNVSVTEINNNLRLELVNGEVLLERTNGLVECSLVNGNIRGKIDSTNGMKIDLINGDIVLFLKQSVQGFVRAEVKNGRVEYENLKFENEKKEKRSLNGRLGQSGNSILVDVVNGKIKFIGTEELAEK